MAASVRPHIACPVQRVLAAQVGRLADLFSEHFASLEPGARLVRQEGKADDDRERVRNLMRMPLLGAVVRMGLDLGLTTHALHGHVAGYTQVPDLMDLHYQTCGKARGLFDAMIADRGFVGKRLAEQYRLALARAREQAEGLVPLTGPEHRALMPESPEKREAKKSATSEKKRETRARNKAAGKKHKPPPGRPKKTSKGARK